MNKPQQDLHFYAGLFPLGKTATTSDSNFILTHSSSAHDVGYLQRMLQVEALRTAKNATINQLNRVEEYFHHINNTFLPSNQ